MKLQGTQQKPGDKGQWYLRMLGMEPDGSPTTLQEVARNREADRTSELVTGMWNETAETAAVNGTDPLGDWKPTELSATAASRRRVRWPIVVFALVIGVGAALALWWLPQASDQRAAAHADLIRESLNNLYGDLSGLQQSLATVTEPTAGSPDLGTISLGLSSVADSSARLLDIANEPAPSPLPLSATEPFDDLDEFRVGLEPHAAEATALRSEVAEIAEYRLALSDVLDVGELPLTADSATINDQVTGLAQVLAASVAALNEMAVDGPFAAHRVLVDLEVNAFAQWQDDYLSALRSGDPEATGVLVEQLRLAREAIGVELVTPLAALRTDIDNRILDLADRLSRAISSVPE